MHTAADPRLPLTATPVAYRLELAPDLERFTFDGTVEIDLDIPTATRTLVCNATELAISDAHLRHGDVTLPARVELDEASERLTLHTETELPAGSATLHIRFTGTLNDQLHGFYRSTYTATDGSQQTIATTQFQSTDARRCFPCWDEPAYKAVFTTTLIVAAEHLAITNTNPVSEETLSDGRRRIAFAPTMPMSTYLVAFVVGPLEATEPVDALGVPVRVVHRPGQGHLTGFAVDVAVHALRWFADYYGIPYPSDKVDLVAIPDFAFGAMENLGCVTFREVLLLIDPNEASQPELQRAADVINHELAHMWFGDLVTMRWWEGIWLNEAFATFMEVSCSHAYRPDWNVWDSFARARSAAFDVDALHHTRPIEFPVVTPQDAEGMFDLLTYEKGAAVVRMLEQYLGATVFRDGVREYLRRHSYGNTETRDLWDALEHVSGEPVRALMDPWIYQGGHPLVDAQLSTHGLRISQRHFTLNPDAADDRRWVIPLRVNVDGIEQTYLLSDESMTLTGVHQLPDTLNAGGTGFFRSAINASDVVRAGDAIRTRASATERHSIVDDVWALTVAGDLSAVDCLTILETFSGETDLNVWQALATALHGLDRLTTREARVPFAARVRQLAQPVLDQLGVDPSATDDDRTRELRATLVRLLGTTGESEPVRALCRDRLDHHDPSLAAAALVVTAHHGDRNDFEAIEQRWRHASDPQTEQRNLRALADFPDQACIERLLAAVLDGSIRSQDGPYVLARALQNRHHGERVWEFVSEHWDELNERFPSNSIARMLTGITALDTTEMVQQVAAFLDAHPVPQAGKQVDQHRERQAINAALRDRARHELSEHLLSAER